MCKDVPSGRSSQDRSDALRKLAFIRRATIKYEMYLAIVNDIILANPSLRLENREENIFAFRRYD